MRAMSRQPRRSVGDSCLSPCSAEGLVERWRWILQRREVKRGRWLTCSDAPARPHYDSRLLAAETRFVPSIACTEHRTSASPAKGWPHRFIKCGARASAQVAGKATVPAVQAGGEVHAVPGACAQLKIDSTASSRKAVKIVPCNKGLTLAWFPRYKTAKWADHLQLFPGSGIAEKLP